MPNWCDNRITIHGPKKYIRKIDKIVNENTNGDGLLNYMMPMPTELKDTTSPSSSAKKPQPVIDGHDNWYDWRVNNWGTKWELCEFFGMDLHDPEDSDEATISFSCQSAWSPPLGALEYFDMNTECSVKITYYEGGMDFMGIWSSDEGDRCWSISETAPRSDDPWWGTPEGIELDGDFGITETMAHYEEEQENEGARKTRELVVEKKAQNMEEA